ncbi:FidL-like protein [Pantoea sp. KPR_PJ]|uniref:FidL-like protein n=1 Tax=Pantoea sp. KPR_PJ TaxID=2738375 RepID=UPI0035295BFD
MAALLVVLILAAIGADYFTRYAQTYPFRCSTFTRYDLSRTNAEPKEFAVSQDLRLIEKNTGYLLLNGQVTDGNNVTVLNRTIELTSGDKTDYDTWRYRIDKVVKSSTDNTPDTVFDTLLAELTLDASFLQLNVIKVDQKSYLIGGPLSFWFTCQRY